MRRSTMTDDWTPDIAALQAHDDAEWRRVERTFCGRLHAYAQRRVGDVQGAEDVVQESLLGAVRGIKDFDPRYSFEQYLFGICRNRTIDHLRRRKARAMAVQEDEDHSGPNLDNLAQESETPSAIVRGIELSERARELLGQVLSDWVAETVDQGEFQRLAIVEALFAGGWRNRDAWRYFGLGDETAVAGVKFRALKRIRQLAARREGANDLLPLLAVAEEGGRLLDMDVSGLWRAHHLSCPPRDVLERLTRGEIAGQQKEFVEFHLVEMNCPWCKANRDDIRRGGPDGFDALVERLVQQRRALDRE
jgi:RNA polymerase sigma-70 factor (ECF subfamily)